MGEGHSLETLRSGMANWLQAWERPFVVEAEDFVQAGDRIAVLIRWKGTGRGSGVSAEAEGAHLWTFRNGLLVRFEIYRERDKALAALHEGTG